MVEPLRLMGVFAHPDDESMGVGGALARYAAEGVETSVVCATRGERGWQGDPADNPGLAELGRLREAELRAAAQVLGIRHLHVLDYIDGDLDQADPPEATRRIVALMRRQRPQVVITFGLEGAYGHPDHIAISQLTLAACVCAADAAYPVPDNLPPHRVAKVYFMATTPEMVETYIRVFGNIVMTVDGVDRQPYPIPRWQVTTLVDTRPYWRQVWQAIQCHTTQLAAYSRLADIPEADHELLWGEQRFVRAYSLVSGGRAVETDLFAGLRG